MLIAKLHNILMNVKEKGYENGKWMELAKDYVHWQFMNLLPETSLIAT